ncbi:MAG TPA: hypothetical protein VHY56_10465 [Candidatus Binataceae bacterium]|nr:hypothetical protein [Candidatus Binataceae bacterium]
MHWLTNCTEYAATSQELPISVFGSYLAQQKVVCVIGEATLTGELL